MTQEETVTVDGKASASIDAFFSRLGIIKGLDPSKSEFWEDLWQGMSKKGCDPRAVLETFHPMSPEVAELYFIDEETGIKFLSADIERFRMLLTTIESQSAFSSMPEKVVEIGGGPGIVSLWLACKFRNSRFLVYDVSEKALDLGQKLAAKLEIDNIEYRKASYLDLSKMKNPEKGGLILGLSALFLILTPNQDSGHFTAETDPFSFESPARDMASDFVKACSNLLDENGLIYFSQGAFNDLGLLTLFTLFRKNRLGMDWQKSSAIGEGEGASFSFKEIHIFAGKNLPQIFPNAREDLRTFLYSGKSRQISSGGILGHSDFETYLGLLSGGIRIAEVVVKKDIDLTEKFMIYCKAGLLGFFSTSNTGRRSGFLGAAADFKDTADRLRSAIEKYRSSGAEIISEYWNPDYERLAN